MIVGVCVFEREREIWWERERDRKKEAEKKEILVVYVW